MNVPLDRELLLEAILAACPKANVKTGAGDFSDGTPSAVRNAVRNRVGFPDGWIHEPKRWAAYAQEFIAHVGANLEERPTQILNAIYEKLRTGRYELVVETLEDLPGGGGRVIGGDSLHVEPPGRLAKGRYKASALFEQFEIRDQSGEPYTANPDQLIVREVRKGREE